MKCVNPVYKKLGKENTKKKKPDRETQAFRWSYRPGRRTGSQGFQERERSKEVLELLVSQGPLKSMTLQFLPLEPVQTIYRQGWEDDTI